MIEVFHKMNSDFQPTLGVYEKVAEVETKDLTDVFRLTNHIHDVWGKNEEVKLIKESRSTSVGDVVKMDGKFYLCDVAGWKGVKNVEIR